MAGMLLYLLLSIFYGFFAFFAFTNKSYISLSSFAMAFLLVFPVIRILLKPKEIIGILMLFLSFAFFFAGVYTYPVTTLPLPSLRDIAEALRGPLLGL